MTPLVLTTFTAVNALGRGIAAIAEALVGARSGLQPCRFENVRIETYAGEVAGLDDMKIAASHPALPGHFPGSPVTPGVVLLDMVAAALPQHIGCATRVTGFPAVKFLSSLLPEREFEVVFAVKYPGQAAFVIVAGDEKLTSGIVNYIEVRPTVMDGGITGNAEAGFRS